MDTCYLCLDKTIHIRCEECNSNFCCTCSKYYHQQESLKKHNTTYLPSFNGKEFNKNTAFCSTHKTEILKFYCRTCGYKLICLDCMNEPLHRTHSFFTYKDLIDGFSDRLIEFENDYQQLLHQSSSITNSLNELVFFREVAFHEAKKDIEDQFFKIEEKLNQKKNFLLGYLENLQNLYKDRLSSVTDESNNLIDQLSDKFLELGNFSLSERNSDILNQQRKLDEMNDFLEKAKQLNYETKIFLDINKGNLKIVPRIHTKLLNKVIEELWFTEIQSLNFTFHQTGDKLLIENLDKYDLSELFSEIREEKNCVMFKDIKDYINIGKKYILEFEIEAFNKSNSLIFQLRYKNSNNFVTLNAHIIEPNSKIKTLSLISQSDVPVKNIWFSTFVDPITKKCYFFSNYDSISLLNEYETLNSFTTNPQNFKSIEIDDSFDGTYVVAYNGCLYYNLSNTNKISMSSLTTGIKEIEFSLKTRCFRNTASFRWGGLNDIAFIIDSKTMKRYVLFQKNLEEQNTYILEITSNFKFDTNNSICLPLPKKSIGFCFVYENILYIGIYHYKPEIQYCLNLKENFKGLENFNLIFEKSQFITNISTMINETGTYLIVSDFYSGVLIYKINF